MRICNVEACGKPHSAKGLCKNHYAKSRWYPGMKKNGDRHKQPSYLNAKFKATRHDYRRTSFKYKYRNGKRLTLKYNRCSFDLTFEEYEIVANQPCYYCNKAVEPNIGLGLDRIDNSKGYEVGNILPCCKQCNLFRGDHVSSAEFKIMMNALIEHRKGL